MTLGVLWTEGRVARLSEHWDADASNVDLMLQLSRATFLLIISIYLVSDTFITTPSNMGTIQTIRVGTIAFQIFSPSTARFSVFIGHWRTASGTREIIHGDTEEFALLITGEVVGVSSTSRIFESETFLDFFVEVVSD